MTTPAATLTRTTTAAAALDAAETNLADAERNLNAAYTDTAWRAAQLVYIDALRARQAAHFEYTQARAAETNAHAPHRRTVAF